MARTKVKNWIKEDINFGKLLFYQIFGIQIAISKQYKELAINSIRAFELVLCPYVDDQYKKDMARVDLKKNPKLNEQISKARRNALQTQDWSGVDNTDYKMAIFKFQALMKMANRHGLLPQPVGWDDEDDYDKNWEEAQHSPTTDQEGSVSS